MINILKTTIEAIDNFDITATVETLKNQYPYMRMAEINIIVKQQLTYLGASNKGYYCLLLKDYQAEEVRKKKDIKRLLEMIYLVLIKMFKDAIKDPTPSLVEIFNNHIRLDNFEHTALTRPVKP
jgi:uncharacterized pyridoxamine 5'-phosphate oxidase family protein